MFGIVYHLAANDDNCNDMHKYCEKGADSFCMYQKAVVVGDTIAKHPRCISLACRDRVLDSTAVWNAITSVMNFIFGLEPWEFRILHCLGDFPGFFHQTILL